MLLSLLLTGCHGWAPSQSCVFGGAAPAEDRLCAERNFGKDGAAYFAEKAEKCPRCRDLSGPLDPTDAEWQALMEMQQFCVLNCH